ncbi:BZ3500_MvSof-1268-A1-R1_Chr2-1g04561 [Microbotryum saponariae]|uniref:Ribosomal RNA-processing protein 8 n=1 Tax=Microbotryum saponariae TaxID=289078 RepID=A0A2X0MJW9_9BASI|nr:BZ3500_MvSof-1268-A1-R1_Chr2-1g04561 [Microbotryum saponariae]SCZ92025.1 BZ3501_MvSof-1269-A2-R1_Chr2-1g04217 [Microbotryum saponariae]
MLFDTPLLSNLPPIASSSTAPNGIKKRPRAESAAKGQATAEAGMNLDKLMKKMKGMDTEKGTNPNSTPVNPSPRQKKDPSTSNAGGAGGASQPRKERSSKGPMDASPHSNKNIKKHEQDNLRAHKDAAPKSLSSSARPRESSSKNKKKHKSRHDPQPAATQDSEDDSISTPIMPRTHAAPNFDEKPVGGSSSAGSTAQTSLQASLRAKLAGGKFRMLNETLYTTTGEQAWSAMKEDGAFDDVSRPASRFSDCDLLWTIAKSVFVSLQYHAGFRSQAAGWPVHPLTLIKKQLSTSLPALSLVADFGCGDATLARDLAKDTLKELKVISFDLVSKDGWVVEAECSSVPLPGGRHGGQIVDVVVCCLSLMGTDWVKMVRESWRVLKPGGQLKIAEVLSRFTDIDGFVALVSSIGFKSTSKDTSNTHFIMFDFVKAGEEAVSKQAEITKKASSLLRPCIYKKR